MRLHAASSDGRQGAAGLTLGPAAEEPQSEPLISLEVIFPWKFAEGRVRTGQRHCAIAYGAAPAEAQGTPPHWELSAGRAAKRESMGVDLEGAGPGWQGRVPVLCNTAWRE